ncbi:hypothetical protein Agabi119p4_7331 [Agaricus bisporus var. burnettii]|uniref:SWI/SNF and RSC complexes subunit Ssr4 N-terminal domain-containing protein n=1 Tax=Agaricus bisporus var. burnettii TaxID=192524 RepID=A0A8H7C7V9_AGABI|nr:hypothetical protein Agabi119p4_7331 [Agaricus bisporus var. burnettii]
MSSLLAQAQSEGPCLRYPESAGMHREINLEAAINMLLRATHVAQTVPFTWGYIDKPAEGQTYVIFLPPDRPFPNDGVRYQDNEGKYGVPAANGREMEVCEIKFGFVPNSQDQQAWRFRRRYRLIKGGHPQLVLVHYTRGPPAPINPTLFNQPVRVYPLRGITESGVFVAGERAGQKAQPPQGNMMHNQMPSGGMPAMGIHQQQAMLAHQNSNMEMMERRQRERQAAERTANSQARQPRPEEDDSGDEVDQVSTRTLAMTRYKRNHELMNAVFQTAAFGNKALPPNPKLSSIFSPADLETKVEKLQSEIEQLKQKSDDRRARSEQQKRPPALDMGDNITL